MFNRDPYDDFVEYDRQQEAELKKRPVCVFCGEHIQDDYLFELGNDIICEKCLNDNFRKYTEDYID